MKRRTFLAAATGSLAATQLARPARAAGSTAGHYTVVARLWGAMPTGVTVSRHGRTFLNFPRWGDDVPFTVAELRDGKPVAYPNAEVNACRSTPGPSGSGDLLGEVPFAHAVAERDVGGPAHQRDVVDDRLGRHNDAGPGARLLSADATHDDFARGLVVWTPQTGHAISAASAGPWCGPWRSAANPGAALSETRT
jgi:hypothetical protein